MRLRVAFRVVLVTVSGAAILVGAMYWLPLLLTKSPAPDRPEDVLAAQNAVRAVSVAALVALGTAATTTIAWRTYALNRLGQVTDRYGKAVAQLGSEIPSVRLGGVYALESILRDSAGDRTAVTEVLSAFVRSHPPTATRTPGLLSLPSEGERSRRAAQDLEAAIRVLAHMPRTDSDRPLDLRGCDLSYAEVPHGVLHRARMHLSDLAWAKFLNAQMDSVGLNLADLRSAVFDGSIMTNARIDGVQASGASFVGADLRGSRIRNSDLTGAILMEANLGDADLYGATLCGARLDRANLRGVDARNADLTGANLDGADLAGADFSGARLTGAVLSRQSKTTTNLEGAQDVEYIRWVD